MPDERKFTVKKYEQLLNDALWPNFTAMFMSADLSELPQLQIPPEIVQAAPMTDNNIMA